MKITYFLRGLGIGIIFSALILSVAFRSSDSSMTDEMVIERAKELGMVDVGDSDDELDKLLSKKEDTTKEESSEAQTSTEELSSESDTTGTASTEGQTTQAVTTEEATTQEKTEEAATTEAPKKKTPKTVSITISRGMYSVLVSETLVSLGVIDDAASFNKYLNDNGYAGRLVVGTYKLTPGEDYDSIARKITGR